MFGLDWGNPFAVSRFILTQLIVRSGPNCFEGKALVPPNVVSVDWEATLQVLNNALHAVANSTHADGEGLDMVAQQYDYKLRLVGDDLSQNCFFLNGERECVWRCIGNDLGRLFPRKSMLEWINKAANGVFEEVVVKESAMLALKEKMFAHIAKWQDREGVRGMDPVKSQEMSR